VSQSIELPDLNIDLETRTLSFDWRKALPRLCAAELHFYTISKDHQYSPRWLPSPQHFLRKSKDEIRKSHKMYRKPNQPENQEAMELFKRCFSYSREAEIDAHIWQRAYEDQLVRRYVKGLDYRWYACKGRELLDFRREQIISNFLRDECDIENDALAERACRHSWYSTHLAVVQRREIAKEMGKPS
jgi:hypothetical protein